MRTVRLLFTVFIITAAGLNASPRIGLALGGGGAKGIAHIGILKAFEEAGIPIDMIAGTSAGAFIGGAYACGVTVDELESMAVSGQFREVFMNIHDISSNPIEYRSEALPSQLNLVLKDDGVENPMSVLSDERLNIFLFELMIPATLRSGRDFSNLVLPFRAMTSNVLDRRPQVLKAGSVADAVRASMAYPLAYAPVRKDGDLLMDGGIYDNLPVGTLKDMGADFIIAVNVSDPPPSGKEIQDIEDVFVLLSNVLAPPSDSANVEGYDHFIQVDCSEVGLIDFNKTALAVEMGYRAGREAAEKLKKVLGQDRDLQHFHKRQEEYSTCLEGRELEKILLRGNFVYPEKFILQLMETGEGTPFHMDALERDLSRLLGSGLFSSVVPDMYFMEPDSSLTLELNLELAAPTNIHAGMYYDSNANLNFYGEYNLRINSGKGHRLRNRLYFGSFHQGIQPTLQLFNVYNLPLIRLRLSTKLGLSYDKFNYNSEILDITRLTIEKYGVTWTGISSFGWNTLADLSLGLHKAAMLDPFTGGLTAPEGLEHNSWYILQRTGLTHSSIRREQPVAEGSRGSLDLSFGKSLGTEDDLKPLNRSFAQISLDLYHGFKPLRSFALYGTLTAVYRRGAVPLGEYESYSISRSGSFTLHERSFARHRLTLSFSAANRFLWNDLWLHASLFAHAIEYRAPLETGVLHSDTIHGTDLFMQYQSPLGPVSYGVSIWREPGIRVSNWAAVGFTF